MGKNDKHKQKHKRHTAKNAQKSKNNDQNKPDIASCSQQSGNEEARVGQDCSVKITDDHIQIGQFKLTNVDLRDIVRKSEQIQVGAETNGKSLTNDPRFMKQLDAYAQQKSEEIINSTVKTLPTTISSSGPTKASKASPQTVPSAAKPMVITNRVTPTTTIQQTVCLTNPATTDAKTQVVRKVDTIQLGKEFLARKKQEPPPPPPKVQPKKAYKKRFFGDKLVNPNGEDSPFVAMPIDIDSFFMEYDDIDAECTLLKEWPPLDESMLYYEQPDKIAEKILDPKLPYSFPFTIEVFFALTGIRRRLTFLYSGPSTFKTLSHKFRHKHCESENFQMFYLNHDGYYMEVHDNFTLKQMLITHGAYPRGVHCPLINANGKVLCVPTTSYAEEMIFDRERDLIMGLDSELMEKIEDSSDRLPFALSADFRFAEVYHKVIHYSDEEKSRRYNKKTDALDLIMQCQRTMDCDQIFADCRSKELTVQELKDALVFRYHIPHEKTTSDQSAAKEIDKIVNNLRKSKYQTREALHMIEMELKKLAVELKKSNQSLRAPLKIFQVTSDRFSGPHIVQTIQNPAAQHLQLQIAQPPMQLSDLIKEQEQAAKVIKKQEGSKASENPDHEIPATISQLVEDSVKLAKDVQNLISQRDSLEHVKNQQASVSGAPDPVVLKQLKSDAAFLTPNQLKDVMEMAYDKMLRDPYLSNEPMNLSSAKYVETVKEFLAMFIQPAKKENVQAQQVQLICELDSVDIPAVPEVQKNVISLAPAFSNFPTQFQEVPRNIFDAANQENSNDAEISGDSSMTGFTVKVYKQVRSDNESFTNEAEKMNSKAHESTTGGQEHSNEPDGEFLNRTSAELMRDMLNILNKAQKSDDAATKKKEDSSTTEKKNETEDQTELHRVSIVKTESQANTVKPQTRTPPLPDNFSLANTSKCRGNPIKENNLDYPVADYELRDQIKTSPVDTEIKKPRESSLVAASSDAETTKTAEHDLEGPLISKASIDKDDSQTQLGTRNSPTMQNTKSTSFYQKNMDAKKND